MTDSKETGAAAAGGTSTVLDGACFSDQVPPGRLLSNGRYTALVTAAGTGFSRLGPFALTRWSGDRTEDGEGWFLYVRDVASGRLWSFGHQPVQNPAERYAVRFEDGTVCISQNHAGLDLEMDVCVAPEEADVEFRRCTLHNRSDGLRRLDLTSCLEVVLNPRAADAAHPAFSKLFVQTEYVAEQGALLAVRRPRAAGDFAGCMAHWLISPEPGRPGPDTALTFETDRFAFLGRGRNLRAPRALDPGAALAGTVGNVLDPVLSLRLPLELEPGASRTLVFALGAADTRDRALGLCSAHQDSATVERAFAQARRRVSDLAAQSGVGADEARALQDMATDMLYAAPRRRASAAVPQCRASAPGVPGLGIGGDRPLVLVKLNGESPREGPADSHPVARFARAQAYWAAHGLDVDLAYLCGGKPDPAAAGDDAPGPKSGVGSVHVFDRTRMAPDAVTWLEAVAAMVVAADGQPGAAAGHGRQEPQPACARPARPAPSGEPTTAAGMSPNPKLPSAAHEPLLFDNGYGGFSSDGTEYVIRVDGSGSSGSDTALPPLPWTHVIANETFGFLISETGAGCTWAGNSRLNRLTPWYNDPVADPHGEAVYIRDDDAGIFWSPMPGPVAGAGGYTVRYGFGTCRFVHHSAGIKHQTTLFVAGADPVKVTEIRLRNDGTESRSLALFAYDRLVLGGDCAETGPLVHTRIDRELGAVFARNPLRQDFAGRVAFAAVAEAGRAARCTFTTDREEFIGRNGSPRSPAAVIGQTALDGRDGPGLDPCFAIHIPVRLAPGESVTCTVLLGEAESEEQARALIARYRQPDAIRRSLDEVVAGWRALLAPVRVVTPAPAIDLMINGWLLYQTLSCRIWGRSAFYQSGGAFGFRDQLQDAAAFVHTRPELTRRQILLHAAHQFAEGDVMHWWHPPASRGMRTRFSDDLLWLPFVTLSYLDATGERAILDEVAPYLRAPPLQPGEDETYLRPEDSGERGSLYDHCCRALDRSLTQGAHGLPLMGTGDWNDGMNRVGREGRGESVWLGFFLYFILTRFALLCRDRGDDDRAGSYETYTAHLARALNDAGWDGAWYRRAYYDDGTPLGSAQNDECRIDALVQAWAVISAAAPPNRAEQALDAMERHLVSEADGLIRLLTPPFDRTPHDPGYIKGYVPGVRENGGQYTHAALWAVRALAEAGRTDRAARLLEMISPVTHGATADAVARYKVEPYVVAADVYGTAPHVGRGGWTWYTGSAAWMYRVFLETLLGVRMDGGTALVIAPRLAAAWPEVSLDWTLPDGTVYAIILRHGGDRRSRVFAATIDGDAAQVEGGAARVPLARDGRRHQVIVQLG